MPRIVDINNQNIDLCSGCYRKDTRSEDYLMETYGTSYDLDVAHPDYAEDIYTCESCQHHSEGETTNVAGA